MSTMGGDIQMAKLQAFVSLGPNRSSGNHHVMAEMPNPGSSSGNFPKGPQLENIIPLLSP